MQQRDLLKDQIEQLGKALGKILSGFLGLKNEGKVAHGIEVSNESLKNELDLDIDRIVELEGQELLAYLQSRKFCPAHIELLADYIAETGEHALESHKDKGIFLLKKALELYALVDRLSNSYSMERIHKEEKIQKALR